MAPTQQKPAQQQNTAVSQEQRQNLPAICPPRIPYHPAIEKEFGISRVTWRALVESIFPAARTIEGVLLALSYCKARGLDVMKHPVHIVPIWDKGRGCEVESVWPGIGELRTTAFRTGQYVGKDETEVGPLITEQYGSTEVECYEWARITVYREINGIARKFVGPKVYWRETYAKRGKNPEPNDMWFKRPNGQLEKCAEAAALRAAFPDEIGEYIPEEVERSDARPAATIETLDARFTELPSQALTDDRAAQEERDAVLQATANMTARDEPEPERELVPARQKQEPQQQRSQPATSGSPPPQEIDKLEVWLVERYRDHAALMADHDAILEAYEGPQMTAVGKLIRQRLAALEKKAV